jgi:hypothetical protein
MQIVRPEEKTALLPFLIERAGERASWRFLEFFTVNIRNPRTRLAYARAAGEFLRWCEGRAVVELSQVMPLHVAGYIEQLQGKRSEPTVKQHLACIRVLFDWLARILPMRCAGRVTRSARTKHA